MKMIILGVALMLAGCGASAAEKAEAQYRMIEKNNLATYGERCSAATKVADAYLQEGKQQPYETWQLRSRLDCGNDPSALAPPEP